jgi:hypothetical protein
MPPLTVRPADGGQLITRADATDAGIPHYTVKRNMRRDLSDEILREGWDYWNPFPEEGDYQSIPFPGPSGEPLTLILLLRRPNGETAVIAGTQATLWRLKAPLDGYMENPPLYVDGLNDGPSSSFQPYFEDPTRWEEIATGFSPTGKRWEVAVIDGTAVFNNSVDLPVAFRVEWRHAMPLYELREQGIVCVGTITDHNGVLMLGDITELREDDRDTVLNVIRSGNVKAQQAGYKSSGGFSATSNGTNVTATGAVFANSDVGRMLVWWNGKKQRITAYTSPTQVTVAAGDPVAAAMSFRVTDLIGDPTQTAFEVTSDTPFFTSAMVGMRMAWADGTSRKIAKFINSQKVLTDIDLPAVEGEVFVENPITYLAKDALEAHWETTYDSALQFNRYQYRIAWGEVFKPTRFAIPVPVTFAAASAVLITERMAKSLEQFEEVTVTGAGVSGGVLNQVTITNIGPGIFGLSSVALTGGSGTVQRSSSVGSIVGHHDIQDDGSAILKMMGLQDRIIAYTETHIFIGFYTSNPTNPFLFEKVEVPHGRSLYYRNTLVKLQGRTHVYAGKTQFYSFDLTNRTPTAIPSADLVSNLFFDNVTIRDTERIFAADVHNTQEIWFVVPSNPPDPTIAYDYRYGTFSTIDFTPGSVSTTREAVDPIEEDTGDWVLMGSQAGVLLQYGLSTEPVAAWNNAKSIYYRRAARPYNATQFTYNGKIASGLIHAGDAYNEKHFTSYVLAFSSLQGLSPNCTVSFYTALNPSGPQTLLGTVSITDADNHGLIPLHCIAHMIKDELTIPSGAPVRVHSRTWDVYGIRSRSHHRK